MINRTNVVSSIIIPVYNDFIDLKKTLKVIYISFKHYNKSEIIVVDNGSTENIKSILEEYPNIKIIEELEKLNSPYSARNRGIEISRGNYIILLDSTCKPDEFWLVNLMNTTLENNIMIAGGNV